MPAKRGHSGGRLPRPGCFARDEVVPPLPALSTLVVGFELLRRSPEVTAMMVTFRVADFPELLPVLQEAADQSGIQLEIQGSPTSVTVRLSPSGRRPV